MKKKFSFTLFVILCATQLSAQTLKSTVGCDLTLNIQSNSGTNGLGIVFSEKTNSYYTAFAGNKVYPLEGFSAKGEHLFSVELGMDARGFWYNSSKNTLEGIGYGNKDSYSIPLSANLGQYEVAPISSVETESYGMGEQQVGVNAGSKGIMFVENNTAYFFKKIGKSKSVSLSLESSSDNLNQVSPIYTGVKGKEIGIYNFDTQSMEFYSASNGKFAGSVVLEYESCSEEIDQPYSFRVAYTNNRVWLYDTFSRSWIGFSIWNK